MDAHNVVPCWEASPKLEVGARTLRPKLTAALPSWLVEIPRVTPPADTDPKPPASLAREAEERIDWDEVKASLDVDRTVAEVEWCAPGASAAAAALRDFCATRLRRFADGRNDPNERACSELSPYLHYGHLSAQRMALVAKASNSSATSEGVKAFLEESIVRRELADNFCHYQPNYDNLDGAASWARLSLELHASDAREHTYTLEQLDDARSHEDLWNAAQRQLRLTGKMHGFMRMYWAKKILEWSPTPAEALARAIHLNDKYSLDGRDPNGYVGCAWSVMGTHDMGWAERAVFGKIRYMNYNGCVRKFDVKRYVATWCEGEEAEQAKAALKAAEGKRAAKSGGGGSKRRKSGK